MIKKHEIIKSYQVLLYCDKCGKEMKFDGFDVKKELYRYKCNECGEIQYSNQNYPYIINHYKIEGEIIN